MEKIIYEIGNGNYISFEKPEESLKIEKVEIEDNAQ